MSERCILCNGAGQRTREHIWPEWYSELKKGQTYEFTGEINDQAVRRRTTKQLDLAPKVLCHPCNHNWGSGLEGRMRAVLQPMIDGQPARLSLLSVRTLVAWATLKFMTADWLTVPSRGGKGFFSLADGKRLRSSGAPSPWSKLWIGRYVGSKAGAGWIMDRRSPFTVRSDVGINTEVYAVTYSIGQVLIQLLSVRWHEELNRTPFRLWAPAADWDAALTPIWPLPHQPVEWPPAQAFDDAGFEALAERWHQPQQDREGQPHDQPAR